MDGRIRQDCNREDIEFNNGLCGQNRTGRQFKNDIFGHDRVRREVRNGSLACDNAG